MTDVKLGDRNNDVVQLQQQLNVALGLNLTADGAFGPRTKAAVKAFQAKAGIPATGVADAATSGALAGAITKMGQIPDLVSAEQLIKICGCTPTLAKTYARPLSIAMAEFGIDTPKRIGAFLANVAVECGQFQDFVENLNYSAVGLSRTWPSRYAVKGADGKSIPGKPNDKALSLEKKPQAIAIDCYGGRMGNAPAPATDGWDFRGRGMLMNTGRAMYAKTGPAIGLDLESYPDDLTLPLPAARAAAAEWKASNINKFADIGDFDGCCDMVNIGHKTEKTGDANGYLERQKYYTNAKSVLGF